MKTRTSILWATVSGAIHGAIIVLIILLLFHDLPLTQVAMRIPIGLFVGGVLGGIRWMLGRYS